MLSTRLLAALLLAARAAWALPPVAGPAELFVGGIAGPEGLAFGRDGSLFVGTTPGDVLRIRADGSSTLLASVGEQLAGITVLQDGRVLGAAFATGNIWAIDPNTGAATVLASGVMGPNFIVQTRHGQILVSASNAGTIVDVTSGTPIDRATGLTFPDGLAIGRDRALYVAETFVNRVSRLSLASDGTLGPPAVYATNTTLADGIEFDRAGNLLVLGLDTLQVVRAHTTTGVTLSTDVLLNWPSNLAFGRGHGFRPHDIYMVNYGLPLGSGTEVIRLRYNRGGLSLIR
jgi:sugar lactone lactonase YvrE